LIDGFGRVYPSQDHLDLWFARRRVGCVDPGGRRSLGRRDVRRAVKAALMDELSAAVVHAALTSPSSDTGRGLLERARMGDNAAPRDAPGSPIGRCVAVPGRDARRDALQGVIERAIPGLRRWTGRHAVARSLPILLYHSVAPGTAPRDLRRFRVTPEVFETHLRTLADLGFYTVSVDQWLESLAGGPQLRGRPCVITFDDGYEDFDRFAWPQLKRFGFVATVFLVTERVGGTSGWDRAGGETPLMEWPRILDLEGEGVRFGSHTSTHAPLGALAASEVTREVADSRSELARRLKCPAAGLSYPYGDTEPTLPHLIREEGYEYAVGVRPAWATPYSDPFDLPRIEVYGWDSPRDLLAKLWPDSSEGLRR
jgi:peptidoglycan/xylan/chitin deacetylase (PgdA/CDA1 family)